MMHIHAACEMAYDGVYLYLMRKNRYMKMARSNSQRLLDARIVSTTRRTLWSAVGTDLRMMTIAPGQKGKNHDEMC